MQFCTVLHTLKSPKNVGMIVRSHVAHAGNEIIFTGLDLPWSFKKGSDSFSRKLQRQADIVHIANPLDAVSFLKKRGYRLVAIEISDKSTFINEFTFPDKTAIVLGNESTGIPQAFLEQCDHVVTIAQYGNVGSLNVAISASIAMYEIKKNMLPQKISGDEYKSSSE